MSDELLKIPAIARALIEPYRQIIGVQNDILLGRQLDPNYIQTTFVPERDRPSPEHLQAIGQVAAAFSVLERMLRLLVSRLALTPEFPGLAITKDLGIDYQLKALKILIGLHKERYREQIIDSGWLGIIESMMREFNQVREERNIVVHTVWYQRADKLHGLRPRPTTASKADENPSPETSVPLMQKLATEIQNLADAMFVVSQYIPEVDEAQLAKFLALKARPLPPATR
jgi:hypothetical protein